jgi:REP element-mobilizing transposase RayT
MVARVAVIPQAWRRVLTGNVAIPRKERSMPRAHRHFLPGQIWHITHRCHERNFLLKFARDRENYLHWLFEAKKRYGLCVLDYAVTSNHVHLLLRDTGRDIIARSMQLVAGRTGQEFNRRKGRQGAFWEDRYHATAVESGDHLHRCIAYIDLNMVRAGAVRHPGEWAHGGYREIQNPPRRYALIDLKRLAALCGFAGVTDLQQAHRLWVTAALHQNALSREGCWSEALAVGSESFATGIRRELAMRAKHREVVQEAGGSYTLRQPCLPYHALFGGKKVALRQ